MTCSGPSDAGCSPFESSAHSYVLPCQSSEVVRLWLFDRQGRLAISLHETGDHGRVIIPLPALARALALTGAAYVFMAHNHPSGDPHPSAADIEATRQVWRVTRMLGASLQDHFVVTEERWFSFRSHGLL